MTEVEGVLAPLGGGGRRSTGRVIGPADPICCPDEKREKQQGLISSWPHFPLLLLGFLFYFNLLLFKVCFY